MKMGLPTVKESCCGCALETGTKIIGYVHLILSCVLFLFVGTVAATILGEGTDVETSTVSPVPTELPKNETMVFGKVTSHQFGLVVSAFIALAPAVVGISSLLLLIGAKKKMPYLLLPWLVGMTVLILTYMGLLLIFLFILCTDGSLDKHFISVFTKIGVSCYCYLVVYSFYKELRDDEESQQSYVC
ncbi:uncharacterized protein LOC142331313 [Lycorma delicatula]|uniref:uncharacterized protein LOC142331313 n=1 Tax=Lycorma delicatula TaxID=130591 RepID=UPI003F512BB4